MVVHAYAVDRDGGERLVPHHVRHSPTGFEFGYHGSGPAELARYLLIDYLDLHQLAGRGRAAARLLPAAQARSHRPPPTRQKQHVIEVETIDAWMRAQSATRRP